jgi:hypothetical protein
MAIGDHYSILGKPTSAMPFDWAAEMERHMMEKSATVAAQKPQLPSWAINPSPGIPRLSLPGMLWLRLMNHNLSTQTDSTVGLFSVGLMIVLCVHSVTHEDDTAVAVFTIFDDQALVLHDKYDLFPSDSLVTKIITLIGK